MCRRWSWPWSRHAPRSSPGQTAVAVGRRGERLAVRALRRAGYRILARNVRTPRGEVDALAVERGHLVVVEVKTTATEGGLPPGCRLGGRQRRRLEAAGRWLAGRSAGRRLPLRYDLVSVTLAPGAPRVVIHRGRFGCRPPA
jgi:putative endonuclease